MLLIASYGFSQNWKTSFDEAKFQAKKENKNILLVFSGSDWCAPCIKLNTNVFQSELFKTESTKWVLYNADFPKRKKNKLPTVLSEANNKLAERYNNKGYFPLVVLLNPNEKILGKIGYKNVSAKEYIDMIDKLEKK